MSNSTCGFGRIALAGFCQSLWQNSKSAPLAFCQSLDFRGFGLWQGGFGKIALAGILPKQGNPGFGAILPYGEGGLLPKPPARSGSGAA